MKELSDIPAYPVTLSLMERPPRNDAERAVRGIYKTADCNEVAKKLSSGNWIAFDAKIAADGSMFPVQRTFRVLFVDSRQNHFMFTLKRPTAFYVPLCIIFVRYHNAIHDYHLLPVFIVSQERGAHKEVKPT